MIGLTLEQILQLHALVLVKDCGAGGVRLNNYHFDAISGELEDFAVRIATDHLSIAEIADWLRAHVNEKELQ
mgnify:FL=1